MSALFQCLLSWKISYTIGWNLIWTQWFKCLHKVLYTRKFHLSGCNHNMEKLEIRSMLPLESFGFFLYLCFYFHNLDKFGEDNYLFMSFINIWVWWVGFWVTMSEVWFQTRVQFPLKVLVLV
jgi:hypothetical protein